LDTCLSTLKDKNETLWLKDLLWPFFNIKQKSFYIEYPNQQKLKCCIIEVFETQLIFPAI